jgi:phage baseplate assembly protein W
MAVRVERINPIDLQPRKAVGVSVPFSSKAVFNSTYTTKDALKNNLINFFLTGRGERFLNINLGTGLRAFLFEQITVDIEEQIKQEIRASIKEWFPGVLIQNIEVQDLIDSNSVNIYIGYVLDQTNIQDELVINFQR